MYTAEMWGDGSYGVIDVRPRIPHRVGACASKADAERVARKMNEQHTVNERLHEELERERHDAWVALDGTNVKALRSALEEIRDGIFSGNQAAERARTALSSDETLARCEPCAGRGVTDDNGNPGAWGRADSNECAHCDGSGSVPSPRQEVPNTNEENR